MSKDDQLLGTAAEEKLVSSLGDRQGCLDDRDEMIIKERVAFHEGQTAEDSCGNGHVDDAEYSTILDHARLCVEHPLETSARSTHGSLGNTNGTETLNFSSIREEETAPGLSADAKDSTSFGTAENSATAIENTAAQEALARKNWFPGDRDSTQEKVPYCDSDEEAVSMTSVPAFERDTTPSLERQEENSLSRDDVVVSADGQTVLATIVTAHSEMQTVVPPPENVHATDTHDDSTAGEDLISEGAHGIDTAAWNAEQARDMLPYCGRSETETDPAVATDLHTRKESLNNLESVLGMEEKHDEGHNSPNQVSRHILDNFQISRVETATHLPEAQDNSGSFINDRRIENKESTGISTESSDCSEIFHNTPNLTHDTHEIDVGENIGSTLFQGQADVLSRADVRQLSESSTRGRRQDSFMCEDRATQKTAVSSSAASEALLATPSQDTQSVKRHQTSAEECKTENSFQLTAQDTDSETTKDLPERTGTSDGDAPEYIPEEDKHESSGDDDRAYFPGDSASEFAASASCVSPLTLPQHSYPESRDQSRDHSDSAQHVFHNQPAWPGSETRGDTHGGLTSDNDSTGALIPETEIRSEPRGNSYADGEAGRVRQDHDVHHATRSAEKIVKCCDSPSYRLSPGNTSPHTAESDDSEREGSSDAESDPSSTLLEGNALTVEDAGANLASCECAEPSSSSESTGSLASPKGIKGVLHAKTCVYGDGGISRDSSWSLDGSHGGTAGKKSGKACIGGGGAGVVGVGGGAQVYPEQSSQQALSSQGSEEEELWACPAAAVTSPPPASSPPRVTFTCDVIEKI